MQIPLSQQDTNIGDIATSMQLNWHDQLPLFSYQLFEAYPHVTNVVSTRLGGVSTAPYNSLNLALSTQDDRHAVIENRQRLCRAVGVEPGTLTVGQLAQGLHIAVVTEEIRGRGALDRAAALRETDGLVTNLSDTPLVVLVADCTVVSYFDRTNRVIALAHAGWRGTAGGIASKMVRTMQEAFGSDTKDVLVGISPNIGKDHFQVRDDVLDAFRTSLGDQAQSFFARQTDGSYLLDLNAALLWQLKNSGIQEQHIEVAGICTYERTDLFYSHRREKGKTGRFAGLIVLRSS